LQKIDPSPTPWTVRPYDDNEPVIAVMDGAGGEVGYVFVFAEWPDPEDNPRLTPAERLRGRAEWIRRLQLLCDTMNGTPTGPPAEPRPWRVARGWGWKDARVVSILDADRREVLTAHADAQALVDYHAIVAAVNARWP
jgi:hypothetical protein